MAYDSARERVVVFGGVGSNHLVLGDTWEWDGTTWTMRASGPTPRYGHTMAYDAVTGLVVLFGGTTTYSPLLEDTWEWDGTTWTQRAFLGPALRQWPAMAYDAARGRMVLFGGETRSYYSNFSLGDTWEYAGCGPPSTWYRDEDGDRFGDPGVTSSTCAPPGYAPDGTDCDDSNGGVHPEALEICDGLDNDCDGTIDEGAVPATTEGLMFSDQTTLFWTPMSAAGSYDVIKGNLQILRNTYGGFGPSLLDCVENDSADATSSDIAIPGLGNGFWYLVRSFGCTGNGTYDEDSVFQRGFRDAEIESSTAHCP